MQYLLSTFFKVCWFFILILGACDTSQTSSVSVANLKTEYLTNPIGLDIPRPGFSWIVEGKAQRGVNQSAYRVIVSQSKEAVENGEGKIWDTGKIESGETVNIKYEGQPLESNTKYYWRVRVWTDDEDQGTWSEPHSFQAGLLDAEDWQADWITNEDSTISAPLFRREFSAGKEIKSAYAYATGIGYYEFYLNGEKIGNHVLDPGMTDFRKRVLYETYDVKPHLEEGENAMGLMLGNGAYRLRSTEERYAWNSDNPFTGTPRGIVQLHINYSDGTHKVVTSDDSWRSSASPITYNDVYGGEDYDARREQEGWKQAGFDDGGWEAVNVVELPNVKPDAQLMPPIRVTQTITPEKRTNPEQGIYLFDLGQNIPGWWRIRAEGVRGTELKVRGAETLNDSLFPTALKEGDKLSTKHDYHKNVWTTYILKGNGEEVYEPSFFYTGYRYIEVQVDNPQKLESLEVEGRVVHSDLKRNGHFAASDSLLNRIYRATIWSQRGNLHGYPTDCPHREKGGYNGDGQVIAETSMHDFHIHALYDKWLNDMRDAQQPNGRIPNTSPTIIGGHGGGIAWGSAYILIPWWMHQYYNDQRLLDEHYASMKDYLAYLHNLARNDENKAERYIINEFGGFWDSLGEWVAPGERTDGNNPLVNTYYWYLNIKTMANIAEMVDKPDDRKEYLALADTIKDAFNNKFFDPETHLYGADTVYQPYLLFALDQDLVPEGHRQEVMDNLINDIMEKRNGHLGTGILGTKHLFRVLAEAGREDVIHTMATQKTYPSWGYWIENGATTLWERWNAENSHNHQMFGTVNEYFYKYLAGIRAPADSGTTAGYKTIQIKPYVPENLDWAEASVETVSGKVSSRWEKENSGLNLTVTLPANSTGKISVPTNGQENLVITENGAKVWEQGNYIQGVNGITNGRASDGYITFDTGSGSYSFKVANIE